MLAALSPLQPGDPALSPVAAGRARGRGRAPRSTRPPTTRPRRPGCSRPSTAASTPPSRWPRPSRASGSTGRPGPTSPRRSREWLLPGVGQLPDNCVIALQSDPIFIDAYLAGLNTQLLGELRWRNIPVATGCTPIRRFWDRADTATGEPARRHRRHRRPGRRTARSATRPTWRPAPPAASW